MTLVAKELRALLPFSLLAFFVISGDVIFRPLTERLDEGTWTAVSSIEPGEGGALAFVLAILSFVIAYAALPPEHDEGTIELLYSLPLTRARIFATKMAAGMGVLWLAVIVGQITNWLLVLPNPHSIAGSQPRLDVAITVAFLQGSFASVMYAHGVLASFLRRFGLLPYAVAYWVLVTIEELMPGLSWLSPAFLCEWHYVGRALTAPWGALAFHFAISAGALALAYVLWMGPLERLRDFLSARGERPFIASLAMGCGTVIVVISLLVVIVVASLRGASDGQAAAGMAMQEGVDFRTADATTAHYAMTYPQGLRERALGLVASADATYEVVQRTMGATRAPRITVDLAETSSHHEGIAAGARIRMGLVGQEDPNRLVHVLAHETAHVFQHVESDRGLSDEGAYTRFFIEGSAEWLAFEVVGEPDADIRRLSRMVAASAWERQRLRFEEVIDDRAFRAQHDTALAYALGETFAEGIARACGDAAVGEVVRAFARPDRRQDLRGIAVWEDALLSARCNLESALAAQESVLAETAEQERLVLDAIPRMGGGVERADADEIVVLATLDRAPLPHEAYTLRVRTDVSDQDTELRGFRGEIEEGSSPRRVRFRVPRSAVSGDRFDLSFGVILDERTWPVMEDWQSSTLR